MRIYFIPVTLLALFISCVENNSKDDLIRQNFNIAQAQYAKMIEAIHSPRKNPRTVTKEGTLKLVPSKDWTSGFFPGCLWYLYEYTGEDTWRKQAGHYTANVEQEKYNDGTHDMGFKMYCSFGNGYRLTRNENYKEILLTSARTLITRFNPVVGCIRSWDHNRDKWQYPVIIDNMMNLELLFWATRMNGDSTFYKIALKHAETTLENHFRQDYSTWHVLNYDTLTGQVLDRHTHQGFAHESCWARGQAWGLYGYTMTFRETGDRRFLDRAVRMAEYILNHKNLPEDRIPYWDFDDPAIPEAPRDASAAAIICSALYELHTYVPEYSQKFLSAADEMLAHLSSAKYLAEVGQNNNFLLMHATGNKPADSEIDVPIIYADYYFLEANLRRMALFNEPESSE
jgi:rhamnogalacturonyl hydrolase YesR